MSNENRETGSDEGGPNRTRVGTAERDAALARLNEHWDAGRLDPAEHESRMTRARAAVTQADLDVLFADLPRTGPAQEPTDAVSVSGNRGFLDGRRDTIMAVAPLVAVVLFFVTKVWIWFLVIPMLGIVLYGPGGSRDRGSRDGGSREPNRTRRRGR
jgi:hypothetical protein